MHLLWFQEGRWRRSWSRRAGGGWWEDEWCQSGLCWRMLGKHKEVLDKLQGKKKIQLEKTGCQAPGRKWEKRKGQGRKVLVRHLLFGQEWGTSPLGSHQGWCRGEEAACWRVQGSASWFQPPASGPISWPLPALALLTFTCPAAHSPKLFMYHPDFCKNLLNDYLTALSLSNTPSSSCCPEWATFQSNQYDLIIPPLKKLQSSSPLGSFSGVAFKAVHKLLHGDLSFPHLQPHYPTLCFFPFWLLWWFFFLRSICFCISDSIFLEFPSPPCPLKKFPLIHQSPVQVPPTLWTFPCSYFIFFFDSKKFIIYYYLS